MSTGVKENLFKFLLAEKNSFIFESVEKGKIKGRYTIFGKNPDKIWEFNNQKSYLITENKKNILKDKPKELIEKIIENFDLKQPKTKEFVSILSNFSIENKKSLLFTSENSKNIVLSSNNLKNTKVKKIDDINTYDIINADSVLFDEDSVKKLNEIFDIYWKDNVKARLVNSLKNNEYRSNKRGKFRSQEKIYEFHLNEIEK